MKTWNFIAVFLDPVSKANLRKTFTGLPSGWTWHGDHITLAFNDTPDPDKVVAMLENHGIFGYCKGYRCKAYVTAIAKTDKVCAVRVKLDLPYNLTALPEKSYHITLCTAPGVPPKESNNIPEDAWEDVAAGPVFGHIGYSLNGKVYSKTPLTGRSAKVFSALQGFDFPKGDLMLACRDAGAPITEEQYYKAEKAARKAFVEALTK